MYFGGQTHDYKPNQYVRQSNIAHYDHLWAGYENEPEFNESLKKQRYAEDLKRQIAEKKERDKLEKAAQESEQTFSSKSIKKSINQNSFNSTIPELNQKKQEYNSSDLDSTGFSRSMLSSSLTLNKSNNFAETLRAQIDDCRKSSYSALAQPIRPLAVSQPIPTFAGSSTFDSSNLEMPNLSLAFRSNKLINGHQSQIRSVSMNGTSSIRSSIDQSSLQPPVINSQSPLNRSKIPTPSMGFSTRYFKSKNSTFYHDNISSFPPNFVFSSIIGPSFTSSTQSHLNSNYQAFNAASLAQTMQPTYQQSVIKPKAPLLSESQMIYPDGHGSPL